jgi:hypothetical protein
MDRPIGRTRGLAAMGLAVVGVATLALARLAASPPDRGNEAAKAGRPLPALLVTTETRDTRTLRSLLDGKRSVVVFFSPKCGVCQTQLPALNPFPASLQLVMVNTLADTTVREQRLGAPATGRSLRIGADAFHRAFPLAGLPTIVFVDETGRLVEGLAGDQPPGRIQERLRSFATGAGS